MSARYPTMGEAVFASLEQHWETGMSELLLAMTCAIAQREPDLYRQLEMVQQFTHDLTKNCFKSAGYWEEEGEDDYVQ